MSRSPRRIMVIYGTRPEAIKVAPLISELQRTKAFEVIPAVTGQHREMLDQVNGLFGIRPEHDLDMMVPGATLAQLSGRALTSVSQLLTRESPDAVVVQGDTSTAFMAALAAFYERIPVIHLEAGLRTGDIGSPFPEEANRILTAPLSSLHLAPTQISRSNLLREGVDESTVVVTGNTVIDALLATVKLPVEFSDPVVERLVTNPGRLILVTTHRRESWGAPMANAMRGIRLVAERHRDIHWLLPMHRNPIVRDVVSAELAGLESVHLTEPLSYHEFAHAMNAAHVILTDSGGVQEEAPSLGKPVLVMRRNTERPEAVDAGTVELVGTDTESVTSCLLRLLEDDLEYTAMATAVNPYGDGHAAERAVAAVAELFGVGARQPEFVPGQQEVDIRV